MREKGVHVMRQFAKPAVIINPNILPILLMVLVFPQGRGLLQHGVLVTAQMVIVFVPELPL